MDGGVYNGPVKYLVKFVRGGQPRPSPRRFSSTRETVLEAAARIRVSKRAIAMRLQYGWTEEQALSLPKGTWVRHPRKGVRRGARPGVKLSPLTRKELVILRCLANDYTPKAIHEGGFCVSLQAVHQQMDRMRLKMNVFTTAGMVGKAVSEGIVRISSKNRREEISDWII